VREGGRSTREFGRLDIQLRFISGYGNDTALILCPRSAGLSCLFYVPEAQEAERFADVSGGLTLTLTEPAEDDTPGYVAWCSVLGGVRC
jgi:hypothetical protein